MNATDPALADYIRELTRRDGRPGLPLAAINLGHPDIGAVLADAIDIADSCASADVECNSHWQEIDGRRWFTLDWEGAAKDESEDMLRKSVTYLARRGLIDLDLADGPARVAFKP